MAVTVDPVGDFSFQTPVDVFDIGSDLSRRETMRAYVVAPDGRFLLVRFDESARRASPPEVVLVQHWFEELKRLVPTD